MSGWLTPADGFSEVARLNRPVTIDELFDLTARAAADVAEAIRRDDRDTGEHACSGFLNCLAMFPESMRSDMRASLTREDLAPWLQEIAL